MVQAGLSMVLDYLIEALYYSFFDRLIRLLPSLLSHSELLCCLL